MARIQGVHREEVDASIRKVLDVQEKVWGAPLHNHLLYARLSSVFRGVRGMRVGLEGSRHIDRKLVALLNRRVAALNGCDF